MTPEKHMTSDQLVSEKNDRRTTEPKKENPAVDLISIKAPPRRRVVIINYILSLLVSVDAESVLTYDQK